MRPMKLALFLATALLAHAGANAGDITLYSGANLSGQQITVQGTTPDLNRMGFNDRTGSLSIQSGRWEACQHANFGGECRVFNPGQHRSLDRFVNQISSLREIDDGQGRDDRRDDRRDQRGDYRDDQRGDYRDDQRRDYRDDQRGDQRSDYRGNRRRNRGVELFSGPALRGESVTVRDESRNFEQLNFNDRASSLIVHSGQWQFCQHSDFRGQCVVLAPGRYDRLGRLHNAISSARRVR